jgi:hypothetical protein
MNFPESMDNQDGKSPSRLEPRMSMVLGEGPCSKLRCWVLTSWLLNHGEIPRVWAGGKGQKMGNEGALWTPVGDYVLKV